MVSVGEAVTDQAGVARPRTDSTSADTASKDGAKHGNRAAGRTRRRRVTVDGVVGVLALRDGRWVLANDLEVRVLEALGDRFGARGRLLALAATLDAGMVEGSQLRRLNRLLGEIAHQTACLVHVPPEWLGAVAYACAWWGSHQAHEWLRWALSAQLDSGLVQTGLLPGPGLESLTWAGCLVDGGFGRDTHWITEMPDGFWGRLRLDGGLAGVVAACDPSTSAARLAELAEIGQQQLELLDLVVSHPRCPEAVLRKIASISMAGPAVRQRVAQNLNTPSGVLDQLADNFYADVRRTVAVHPSTSPHTLERLAGAQEVDVRAAAAGNPRLSGWVLEVLADDAELLVRSWVAANASTPPETLQRLLGDRNAQVRACAVANPSTAVGAVAALVADRAFRVRCVVAGRVGIDAAALEVLAADSKPAVRAAVAASRGCDKGLLGRLAEDPDDGVRAAVAANDAAPAVVLELLAADSYWWARALVASNPATGAGLLAVLAGDSDVSVRVEAAENPNTPAASLEVLAGDAWGSVRCFVVRNPAAAEALLRILAQDEDEDVRAGAAANPTLPADLWSVLAEDDSYRVRASAAACAPARREPTRAA